MPESTAKKNLLAEQELAITPTKRPVPCQLNGWLQTYQKQQLHLKKCCPTFRISRKNNKQIYETPTSLGQLKARKQQLMMSSFKKPLLFADKEKTRPDSRSGHTGKSTRRRNVNMREKVPLSRVNEFIADENERNNMVSLIPSTMPFRNRNLKGSMRSKNGRSDKEEKKGSQVNQRLQKRKEPTEKDEQREKAIETLKERIRQQNKLQLLKRKTSNILINLSHKNN